MIFIIFLSCKDRHIFFKKKTWSVPYFLNRKPYTVHRSPMPQTSILKKLQWLFLSILLLVLYRTVLLKWGVDLWHDDNYSHGLLIPFISLYFIKARWPVLQKAKSSPHFTAILIVIAGLFLFLLGTIGSEYFTKRISLIIVLYGLVSFLEGREIAKTLRFPILILFFAVPLPYILYNAVAFPLKLLATKLVVHILSFCGMAVFREGNIVNLTHTTLEVVDACSGIRSLMTMVTLAFFLACMMHRNFFKRLLIILLAIPITVLANAFRVAATGILTGYNPAWSGGIRHEAAGWLIFALSFVILWGISLLLKRGDSSAPFDNFQVSTSIDRRDSSPYTRRPFIIAAAILIAAIFYINFFGTVHKVPLLRPLADFPRQIGSFTMVSSQTFNDEVMNNVGVDHYIMRQYRDPTGYTLGLYIGYYESQTEGEIIHSPKHCMPGSGWNAVRSELVPLPNSQKKGSSSKINRILLQKGMEKQLMHYWYQSRGRVVANEYKDRAYMILDSVFRRRSDGALVRITGPGYNYADDVKKQLKFIAKLLGEIDEYLSD